MPRERRPSAAGPNRRARMALRCFFRRTRRTARRATRRRNAYPLWRQEEGIRGVTVTKKTKTKTAPKLSAGAALRDANHFLLNTYKRPPVVFTHGKGCTVFDASGKKYLDFLGGIAVNALGHAHPRIVRVIRREADRAIHLSNLFHNAFQGPLARKLVEWSGMDRAFFSNSGTEAIEGALKLARLAALTKAGGAAPARDKVKILALENSFHGRTFGALAITSTAKYGAALIADEIQCGLGRTGRYFAYQKFSAKPDIVVVAKPLAGGLPLGAILCTKAIASAISPGLHGTTFGGGPLACAAALEFLNTVDDEKLLDNIRARGAELQAGLAELQQRFDFIREVRGEGLMVGVELSVEGAPFVTEALRRGLLINCTHDFTLRLLPPFIVTARQVREFLSRLEIVLAKTPRAVEKAAPAEKAGEPLYALAAAR